MQVCASFTELPGQPHALIAPSSELEHFLALEEKNQVASAFFYRSTGSSDWLGTPLKQLPSLETHITVSAHDPAFVGPMTGIETRLQPSEGECSLPELSADQAEVVIQTDNGPAFIRLKAELPIYFSGSSRLPDLDEQLAEPWFDVRKHFLSAVPVLLYLKWALRLVSWRAHEAGACFIVDDPILKQHYGFCDFPRLAAQMQEHAFTTSIAMIPWNSKRTSPAMARLMKQSNGRLTNCVHGCDHTGGEFGLRDLAQLDRKVARAKERMTSHEKSTGLSHDLVMVFPQGVFSRESLQSLQQHQFVAAVNTEATPANEPGARLTLRDTWQVALQKYSSFPLYSRRYPSHGLENFAFDLLLGKPCLIVEHHEYFKGANQAVVAFVQALGKLNATLHWRPLGDVIRHSYLARPGANGVTEIRMFGNELLLRNTSDDDQSYEIQKEDQGSVGIRAVTLDGKAVAWEVAGARLTFSCTLPPGREALLRVEYVPAPKALASRSSFRDLAKVAARRYLSEFRDNVLSKHDGLLRAAKSAKALTRGKRAVAKA